MIKLSSPATEEFWEIPVLYEDDHLLALNKPAGLATAADQVDPTRVSLISLLHKGVAEAKPWAVSRRISFLMYSHRLDSEASGVLLLAKSKDVLVRLLDDFGGERPAMQFVALVKGAPEDDRFSIDAKLAPDPARPGLMRINSRQGKRSRTNFEVLERFRGWSLLACFPMTHRRHQVRVHLAYARYRIAGDELYGGRRLLLSSLKPDYHLKPKHTERPLIGRACLHSSQLKLAHPATGAPLNIEAPWPKDLQVAVKYLRKYAVASGSHAKTQISTG